MPDLLTVDFETYYDKDYSLSKLTTEEYIRDKRFQVIGVAVKRNTEPVEWFSGNPQDTMDFLHQYDWSGSTVLAHNTLFDGAILSWRCGIRPKGLVDTLGMSRAMFGVHVGHSLKALATRLGLGAKGTEVEQAIGLRRQDFSPAKLRKYGVYCCNDVELTYEAFLSLMRMGFPKDELRLIDLTLRMFTEPQLHLDYGRLVRHYKTVVDRKTELIASTDTDKKTLHSGPKFAELLRSLGVEPPTKISPATGKETYAFAKSDKAFKALEDHPNPDVQALVAARLGTKSTLEETRTQRFIGIAERGKLIPVPVRYYAAHTGRWGGADKINLQNLPSRGPNAKALKTCITAKEGYVIIDADSSQIEARTLAWWAEQDNITQAFANRDDVYKIMASDIYKVAIDEVDGPQRFVGKTTILGAGYGMGAVKFREQLRNFGVVVDLEEAQRIIDVYRKANNQITTLWRDAQGMIRQLTNGKQQAFGRSGVVLADAEAGGLRLPNGLVIYYPDLKAEQDEEGNVEYTFKSRNGRTKIYGGKVVENCCQALARLIIGYQMQLIAKRYRPALTVHDSIIVHVPEAEAPAAARYVADCMRTVPSWATGLPVDCEVEVGFRYGDGEEMKV